MPQRGGHGTMHTTHRGTADERGATACLTLWDPSMARLELYLFGHMYMTLDGVVVSTFESDKVRALLAYLAVESTSAHDRRYLAGLLWPDRSERAAHLNLNQALANLRQAIGDRGASKPLLAVSPSQIQLNSAGDYTLDVATFTTLLAACDQHPHRSPVSCKCCARHLQAAVELYRGPFLAQSALSVSEAFDEWALVKREWLSRRALQALFRLASYAEQRGDYEQAYRYAWRQLELEPWREEAHRQAMRALGASGQRSAAIAQYERCRWKLSADLGVEPEEETTRLYHVLRRGEALAPHEASAAGTNLTSHAPLTPFVGRTDELIQITDCLENPDCRLLTLVGPGGIGKTRLAWQAASDHCDTFPDGVFFVPLAPVTTSTFLVPAIAHALGYMLGGAADPQTELLGYVREKAMLLVLDNFEHLRAGIDVVLAILRTAPAVVLLITSREPLGLRVEWVIDIHGMTLPEHAAAAHTQEHDALALFLQTARRVDARFSLSGANLSDVVRICHVIGGMPLAIELAAADVRRRSCADIAQGLVNGVSQLATTMQDVPERHRSMRALFDSSWRLLTAAEQQTLAAVAVFRGGIPHDGAVHTANASAEVLVALAEKSLLRRSSDARFRIHELVRQYAIEQLNAMGRSAEVHARHLQWCLDLAGGGTNLHGQPAMRWLDRLDQEHDNLRAALTWAIANAPEGALRLGAALGWFWQVRGYIREGRTWLEQALAAGYHAPAAAQADALCMTGYLAREMYELEPARTAVETSLTLYQDLGDRGGVAKAAHYLGMIALSGGDYTRATTLSLDALALFREAADQGGAAGSLLILGDAAFMQSDYDRAAAYYEEGLTISYAIDSSRQIARRLIRRGQIARVRGDYARATENVRQSVDLCWQTNDTWGLTMGLAAAAGLAAATGAVQEAARLFGATHSLLQRTGAQLWPVDRMAYDRDVTAIRACLNEATWRDAWAEGQSMTLAQAVGYVHEVHGNS